jgi:hypothetical protein
VSPFESVARHPISDLSPVAYVERLGQVQGEGPIRRLRSQADPIPALGEHTEPVLWELGFSTEDLAVMRAEGVISPELCAPDGWAAEAPASSARSAAASRGKRSHTGTA